MKTNKTYRIIGTLCVAIVTIVAIAIGTNVIYAHINYSNGKVSTLQKAKKLKVQVLETFTHDKSSYTQGLFFYNGNLYESAGQYGESSFRQVDLKTGNVIKRFNLEQKYFAEGACVFDKHLYILTWKERKCFVYDIATFKYLGEFKYNGEGWGLTTDGKDLIMSNGTAEIIFLDPLTFTQRRKISVTLDSKPLYFLNELEYINGEIWANVYGEDNIVTINPNTGVVSSVIDCRNLYPSSTRSPSADVLNGIAFNKVDGKIYLTGKYWPKMYSVKVISK